jgi:hypothetical protein
LTSGTVNQLVTLVGNTASATVILSTVVAGLMLMPVAIYFALSEK